MTLTPLSALLLFPAMLLALEAGRRLRGQRALPEGSGVVAGAIFGLLSLLLAFTFSGALTRFDTHRQLLTEEANYIGTAYLRLELLPPTAQPSLQGLFREYVTSRLHLFDAGREDQSEDTIRLQNEIWHRALQAAASRDANPDATKLLIPALNEMIDITATRQARFASHPPGVVYLLLVLFSCVAAFMAGYNTGVGRRDWIQIIILAASITLTVYASLEVEYPRRGLLHFAELDERLIELRDSLK